MLSKSKFSAKKLIFIGAITLSFLPLSAFTANIESSSIPEGINPSKTTKLINQSTLPNQRFHFGGLFGKPIEIGYSGKVQASSAIDGNEKLLKIQITPFTSSGVESKVISVEGITKRLDEILILENFPSDNPTLDEVMNYINRNEPRLLIQGQAKNEKLALLCLAVSQIERHGIGNITSVVRDKVIAVVDSNLEEFEEWAGSRNKTFDLDINKLKQQVNIKLMELRDALLGIGHRAFAVAEYFSDGLEKLKKELVKMKKYSEYKNSHRIRKRLLIEELFQWCSNPKNRAFIAQWERNYAEYLTNLKTIIDVHNEFQRLTSLLSRERIFILSEWSIDLFSGDSLNYTTLESAVIKATESTFEGKDREDLKRLKRLIVFGVASQALYLEVAMRHWREEPMERTFKDCDRITIPNFEFVRRHSYKPFEERPTYEILKNLTEIEATELLGLTGQEEFQSAGSSLKTGEKSSPTVETGGINLQDTEVNAQFSSSAIGLSLPLETIRQFQTSSGLTFKILEIQDDVKVKSILGIEDEF